MILVMTVMISMVMLATIADDEDDDFDDDHDGDADDDDGGDDGGDDGDDEDDDADDNGDGDADDGDAEHNLRGPARNARSDQNTKTQDAGKAMNSWTSRLAGGPGSARNRAGRRLSVVRQIQSRADDMTN